MKNKPDFLVVGSAKSGTTSLFNYLNEHPEIYIPEVKECRFFSQLPKNFKGLGAEFFPNSGITDENEYFSLFDGHENQVCGDISNDYLYYYKTSIENIKKYLGDKVKIIIILRNPIDRAYSNFLHHVREGWEDCSFEEALIKETWRMKNNWAWSYHYVAVGMYYKQVQAYLENFENVKIFLFEDLNDKRLFLKEIYDFLEVENIDVATDKVFNASGYPKSKLIHSVFHKKSIIRRIGRTFVPEKYRDKILNAIKNKNIKKIPMKIETREYLKEIFRDEIEKLSGLLNKDLSNWLK